MIGETLGHYRIESKLGEGGMGVVYKARDTRLDRFVAIKVLSAHAISNPERRLRFVQEAKSASALNHPNIITIYDIDTTGEVAFIAMEYVEGKTLGQTIGHKGLRLGEAFRYAVQIADALAAAHAARIVHRDIKPANIMVTEKGSVKVLDFGLAKLADSGWRNSGIESDPTATLKMNQPPYTDEGVVRGTVAYMSPEQAQGKRIDARSDVFSFGTVLYEMITGRRAFSGETDMSTLAAIINQEPKPAGEIVEELPREIERFIGLCMRKDPAHRFQHMEDLKVALEELKEESESGKLSSGSSSEISGARAGRAGRKVMVGGGIVIVALLTGLGVMSWSYLHRSSKLFSRDQQAEALSQRLNLLISSEYHASAPALSPDGKMIAYVAEDHARMDLFVGRVAGGGRVRLTDDEALETGPQFSPDGEHILFTRLGAENKLSEIWVVPVLGGQATRLVSNASDAAWSPDGSRIAFVFRQPRESDVLATAAADGTGASTVLRSDGLYPFFRNPVWSPDGSQLAVARSAGGIAGELWLVPLKGGSPRRLSKDLPGVFSNRPVFTPDGRGLIHQSNRAGATNLWIVPLEGGPLRQLTRGAGPDESPSVARNGSIAFTNTLSRCALIVHDFKNNRSREILTHSSVLWAPAFSPDGHDLAFSRLEKDGAWHIWIVPVQGGSPRRLTSGALPEIYPRFTPDGASIIYHTWSSEPDRIWRVPRAGGPAVPVTPGSNEDEGYGDISPDGEWLAFARTEGERTRIYVAPVIGGVPRLLTDSASTLPRWSPDGRWIAFSPNRGYNSGVFVIGADGTGERHLSETGGWPVWWPDGKRLGYSNIGPDGVQQILTIPFRGGVAEPLRAVRFHGTNNPFDVSSDSAFMATSNCVEVSSEIWLLEPQK